MQEARGLPRLQAMFAYWVKRLTVEIDSGCLYISGAVEFDDRPGAVRDALVSMVSIWHSALARAISQATSQGHLRADTDPEQMLFEVHGLILALHYDARFLHKTHAVKHALRAFEGVVARYASQSPATDSTKKKPQIKRALNN
jgi:hypothetical protein